MLLTFAGEIWLWKGPAPWYFVTVPEEQSLDLKAIAGVVTYGWGMIPVRVRIGNTEFNTSLWPKDGSFVVPVRASVRKAEGIAVGDVVTVELEVGQPADKNLRR